MRVRTKLTLTLLSLTLVPLVTAGVIAYERGERALRESLGRNFEQMAAEAVDKVDRTLHVAYMDVQFWARLDVMQEVLTGDLDGRVSSFLMTTAREHGDFVSIDAIDTNGEVVASSSPELIGRRLRRDDAVERVVGGSPAIRDVERDQVTDIPVVTFCWPVRAGFDDTRILAALCARWNAGELQTMITARQQGEKSHVSPAVILVAGDGRVLSAAHAEPGMAIGENLVRDGWRAAALAVQGGRGYLVEQRGAGRSFLVGYARSPGHREFSGLGWAALVVQDLEVAFAPIQQLEIVMLVIGGFTAVLVGAAAFVISRQLTRPLVRMAATANRVASGDFDSRVAYRSGDEIGTLAAVFDGMIEALTLQQAQLVQHIAELEQVESELRKAKEAAEESTAALSSVLDTMSEGLITLDPQGTIVMVNQEVAQICGYGPEELLNRNVEILIPPELRNAHNDAFSKYLKEAHTSDGAKRRLQTKAQKKDGTVFPLEISVATTPIGERRLVTAAVRDITERVRAEEQIRASLEEKEVLLREIHHRVKNNLQAVISLLRLQSSHAKDERAYSVFRDSETRLRSMALIHEKLYQSRDLSKIDAEDYIRALTAHVYNSYRSVPSRVSIRVGVEGLVLGIDTAIQCGFIINELVSNALKYAFPDEQAGQVSVELTKSPEGYTLVVKDDGIGLPADIDLTCPETLGLQLVRTFAEHLDAQVEVRTEQGTEFRILFPDIGR